MRNTNHLITWVMQRNLDWLRENSFYLERVSSGPDYTVCYRSKIINVRIIVHAEQREPLFCSIAKFVNNEWQARFIDGLICENKEFAQLKEPFYSFTDLDLLHDRVALISRFTKSNYTSLIGE